VTSGVFGGCAGRLGQQAPFSPGHFREAFGTLAHVTSGCPGVPVHQVAGQAKIAAAAAIEIDFLLASIVEPVGLWFTLFCQQHGIAGVSQLLAALGPWVPPVTTKWLSSCTLRERDILSDRSRCRFWGYG